jgi:hypothetical protein
MEQMTCKVAAGLDVGAHLGAIGTLGRMQGMERVILAGASGLAHLSDPSLRHLTPATDRSCQFPVKVCGVPLKSSVSCSAHSPAKWKQPLYTRDIYNSYPPNSLLSPYLAVEKNYFI